MCLMLTHHASTLDFFAEELLHRGAVHSFGRKTARAADERMARSCEGGITAQDEPHLIVGVSRDRGVLSGPLVQNAM